MSDDQLTLSIGRDEAQRILSELQNGGIDMIAINDSAYVILAVHVEDGTLELEYIDSPITYH